MGGREGREGGGGGEREGRAITCTFTNYFICQVLSTIETTMVCTKFLSFGTSPTKFIKYMLIDYSTSLC